MVFGLVGFLSRWQCGRSHWAPVRLPPRGPRWRLERRRQGLPFGVPGHHHAGPPARLRWVPSRARPRSVSGTQQRAEPVWPGRVAWGSKSRRDYIARSSDGGLNESAAKPAHSERFAPWATKGSNTRSVWSAGACSRFLPTRVVSNAAAPHGLAGLEPLVFDGACSGGASGWARGGGAAPVRGVAATGGSSLSACSSGLGTCQFFLASSQVR
jgi:hypothetical protein